MQHIRAAQLKAVSRQTDSVLKDEEFAQKQLSQFGRTHVVHFQIGPFDKW